MRATEELIAEHEAVLVALRILECVEGALATSTAEVQAHLEQLLEFFQGFVDRCHHGKEEDVLFPELERRGVPREGGPIGVMLAEHEAGRAHVRAMVGALSRLRRGEPDAGASVRSSSAAYRELLRAHIAKENQILFPMADGLISADDAKRLLERFEAIERDRVGPGKHDAYHVMLHRLKETYGIT